MVPEKMRQQTSVQHRLCDWRPVQLRAAGALSREWHAKLAADDPQRVFVAQLIDFIGDRLKVADYSVHTMKSVRALLCINCREIHPDLERVCGEQTLEGCWMLGQHVNAFSAMGAGMEWSP